MKKQALVIGYGNPLRGDDGLGWEVAGRLAACVTDPSVKIMTVQQLVPELAESIYYSELVIFVDASSGGEPGTWKCDSVEPAFTQAPSLGHHFDIADMLAYTKGVYLTCPRAFIISVAAETFELHEDLSAKVQEALSPVVHHIREQLSLLNPQQETAHA